MDEYEYLRASGLTISREYHTEAVPANELGHLLYAITTVGDWADTVKKGLYYGKQVPLRTGVVGTTSTRHKPELADLVHGIVGLASEIGELADHLAGVLRGEIELDQVHVLDEVGDLHWYLAAIHRFLEVLPSDAWSFNIMKLKKRYPEGFFSLERSENRDVEAERAVFEEVDRYHPANHADLCSYQVDQNPQECDCGTLGGSAQ